MAVDIATHGFNERLAALESRVAKIEGTLEQMEHRFASVERRLDSLEIRINWVIGLVMTSWLTIMGMLLGILLKMK